MTDASMTRLHTKFFARTALVMLVMVLSSFPLTYFWPVVSGKGRFLPIYHIHGAAFFAWMALYAWQTHLAAIGRVARHREIGLWGFALSAMMIPLGWALTIAAIERRMANNEPNPFDVALYNVIDITSFTILMMASIASVTRHTDRHRRFTMAAAVALVGPAISRWLYATGIPPFPPLTDLAPSIIADLLLVALAVHDRRTLGRVHPVTIICLAVMVPIHLLTPFAASSDWWRAVAPGLLAITHMVPGAAG